MPVKGVFAVMAIFALAQIVLATPALAKVGIPFTVITTVLEDAVQGALLIVHFNV